MSDAPLSPAIEAEYTLESPIRCPHCQAAIERVQIVRLLRTRVNFTSSLPRRGHVFICPACQSFLAGEVSGLI